MDCGFVIMDYGFVTIDYRFLAKNKFEILRTLSFYMSLNISNLLLAESLVHYYESVIHFMNP